MKNVSITHVKTATTLWDRTVGVIGWKDFGKSNGLLLKNTNSIHTFFVQFPLDLVFLDKKMQIIKLVKNLKPFSISPIIWKAAHVLEMPAGSIEKYELTENNKVDLA